MEPRRLLADYSRVCGGDFVGRYLTRGYITSGGKRCLL